MKSRNFKNCLSKQDNLKLNLSNEFEPLIFDNTFGIKAGTFVLITTIHL